MRDHGGDLDRAIKRYGDGDWIDLSTGINAQPFPVPTLDARAWSALPTRADMETLVAAARNAYGTTATVVPLAGAQAAIQLVPRIAAIGRARVLGPTYNEHAAALRASGWTVDEVDTIAALAGADLAVVVNPNNPDGQRHTPDALRALAGKVGLLVVDESFVDSEPDLSLTGGVTAMPDNIVVLRSFGKFYGLAGLRLGFALTDHGRADQLRTMAGPWAVSGPAIAIGAAALADREWQARTIGRLLEETKQLDKMAHAAGWQLVGGTPLFRTYDTGDGARVQGRLARARIWTRVFPYAPSWVRLGLPGEPAHWARLETALAALTIDQ